MNVRNPHILRTLPFLQFFDTFKKFWTSYGFDIVWMSSLHLVGGQMISEKIKIQKY